MQSLAETVWLVLSNPNMSFLLLVVGVWALVVAITLPGTGLPEATAVVSLALAAVGLVQVPVNLAGLALVALALLLYVLEFRFFAHGALLLAGSAALGVGALLVFQVEGRSDAALQWPVAVGVPLISMLVFGFFISKGLAAQRAPVAQDLGRLIGARGVTRTAVAREGTVYTSGELWSATAEVPIPPETEVVVLERRGLVLKVAPAAGQALDKAPAAPAAAPGA